MPVTAVGIAVNMGGADLVQKWGKIAVGISKRLEPDIQWNLQLPSKTLL